MLGRRELLKTVALAAGATLVAAGTPALAQDQSTAQIGLIAPMSGPWARQGELTPDDLPSETSAAVVFSG